MTISYKGCAIEIRQENDGVTFQCVSYNIGVYSDLSIIFNFIDKIQNINK